MLLVWCIGWLLRLDTCGFLWWLLVTCLIAILVFVCCLLIGYCVYFLGFGSLCWFVVVAWFCLLVGLIACLCWWVLLWFAYIVPLGCCVLFTSALL